MPYRIRQDSDQWCVAKDDGSSVACHDTEQAAQDHLTALNINVDEAADSYTPPQDVRDAAQRALDWRDEYGRGGTAVGIARARDLANGRNISPDTIRRMASFFARHGTNRRDHYELEDGEPSTWRIAWDLWGGDPGRRWAERIVQQMDREEKKTEEAQEDAPNYRAADGMMRCGTCEFRRDSICTRFDFETAEDMVCDGYERAEADDEMEEAAAALETAIQEAGRVLSQKNLERIKAAMKNLQEMIVDMEQSEAGYKDEMEESAFSSLTPLREQERNGRVLLRIIQPGWGSSGYYPAEVLQRDGPRVFTAGTHLYLNHPTRTEEAERPERDVRDLAGELITDAMWIDDGLYAEAKYYNNHRPLIAAIGESLDVSIRADGAFTNGERDGRKGRIIERLIRAESIDFVTRAGAGGRVARLLEAAPTEKPLPTKRGKKMDTKELTALQERLVRLEEMNEAHMNTKRELEAALKEERKARLLTEAHSYISERLEEHNLPARTQARLTRELESRIPYGDGETTIDYPALAKLIKESADAAWIELSEAAPSGIIRGMGGTGYPDKAATADDWMQKLEESFIASGMSPDRAKIAARGGA